MLEGIVYNTVFNASAIFAGNRNCIMRKAMQVIGGAIKGVDNPAIFIRTFDDA